MHRTRLRPVGDRVDLSVIAFRFAALLLLLALSPLFAIRQPLSPNDIQLSAGSGHHAEQR
jgi:hypothetical protein